MQADCTEKPGRKSTTRSRVTNGTSIVPDADGRTVWVRRLRDLIEAHESDLGGTDNLSQAQRSIVRRAATLSVELERMEASFALAGAISDVQLDSYQRASNSLRRLLESLGIKPQDKPKDRWDRVVVMTVEDKALGVGREGLTKEERVAFDAWQKTVVVEDGKRT